VDKRDASWPAHTATWIHGFGAALLPALGAGSLFLPGLPVPISRVAVVALGLAGVLLALAWSTRGRPAAFERRAAAFTLSIILLVAYPPCAAIVGVTPFSTGDVWFGLAFLAGVGALVAALRFWQDDLRVLTAVLVALVGASLVLLMSRDWYRYIVTTDRSWSVVQERLTAPPPLSASTEYDPNILHIVLDGMGRADILAEYGVQQSELAAFRSSGLQVVPDALANYSSTYQAFASALNMSYLDALSKPLAGRADRGPYLTLIHESSVFRALKQRGYQISVIGSGFDVTATSRLSDRCEGCGHGFPNLFESALASILPIRSLVSWSAFYDAHRRRISGALEALDRIDLNVGRATLVIAHVMAPHPPFVFGSRGPIPSPGRPFDILDGRLFRGTRDEYRLGYSEQATYLLGRIRRIVNRARQQSRRPTVVIIHGDHGPGLDFDAASPTGRGIRDRFSILLAFGWPEGTTAITPRSPVNIYRAVFSTFHGATLPYLPDRAFVPKRDAPFQFTEVSLPTGPAVAP
jgi:hypothetical protein